jgi:hypothetical protein
MKTPGGFQERPAITLVLASLVVTVAFAVAACGGSSGSAALPPGSGTSALTRSTGSQGGASPVTSPTTVAQVAAAYADALSTARSPSGFRSLVELFDKHARFEDRAIDDIRVGARAISDYYNYWFVLGPLTSTSRSEFVGSHAVVVEEKVNGAAYGADVLGVRDGRLP